jgi:hypothetical protein
MQKLKDIVPDDIYSTIGVGLILSIKRYWGWRNDPFFRKHIKESIEALKYIRNN